MTEFRHPAPVPTVGVGSTTGQTYLTISEVVKLSREVDGSPTTFAERFWQRVDGSAGADGCWPWTAGRFDTGYGCVWFEGRAQKAHRVAWLVAYGPLGPTERVLHRCDNPPCCNPGHLFAGSSRDNTADMLAKGRANRDGRRHLSGEQIPTIRERYAAGATLKELGAEYGVSHVAIWLVVNRRTWREVA